MNTSFKTVADLKNEVINNAQLQDAFKTDPVEAISKINDASPLETDVWIYRIVVACLGFTILSIITGVIILISQEEITGDKTVPTILTAIGSAAIGALTGLLAPSPAKQQR